MIINLHVIFQGLAASQEVRHERPAAGVRGKETGGGRVSCCLVAWGEDAVEASYEVIVEQTDTVRAGVALIALLGS